MTLLSVQRNDTRLGAADWITAALEALVQGGIEAVRIERLAARLGVAKSGFYYHFRDREDLYAQLLAHWLSFDGAPLIRERSDANATPADRLEIAAEVVDEANLARYDTAIRQWAQLDPKVRETWRTEMGKRISHIRGLFEAAGFEGDELEMRTRTFVAYQVSAREIFPDMSSADRKRLRRMQVDLLTRRD